MAHDIMRLNNRLQEMYHKQKVDSWEYEEHGPLHNSVWLAIVFIHDIEYGRGTGKTRHAAKEEAARNALEELGADMFRVGAEGRNIPRVHHSRARR